MTDLAGRGSEQSSLRASDADRERVAQRLHEVMAEGRLDVGELDERIKAVYAARTYAELEPEDVTVHVDGFGVMGGFSGPRTSMGAPDGPVVRVTGFAFWGGVDVKRVRGGRTDPDHCR